MEKTKQPYKNRVFKVVIQKCEKSKNGFLAKIAWHYLCQEGRKTFWPKCFWTKTVQSRKHYKK